MVLSISNRDDSTQVYGMAAAGRPVPRDHGVKQNPGHLASSTDSFKEDIQVSQ